MKSLQMPGRRPLGLALTLVVVALLGLLAVPRHGVAEPVREIPALDRETMVLDSGDWPRGASELCLAAP
jgi:hypothetical protein